MSEHLSDLERDTAKKHADQNCLKCKGTGVVVWAVDTGRREWVDRRVCECVTMKVVESEDRHRLEYVVEVVRREYNRCMSFGMTPGPEDYKIAIQEWLEKGRLPKGE